MGVVARMARLWLLVLVSLAVFCDSPEAGTIRVERDIASCQEVVKKHSACTAKAHEEYKNFFEKGDDGRPDWLARKTCNYMTESVEVCADLLSDCYSEEELTDQKDSTLKGVLEHITINIDEWDSEKCPPVKAYLDRQKTDETEVDKVEDETVVEEGENKDGENTNETVDEEKQEEGSADGGNTDVIELPAEVENADNVDASPSTEESDGGENSDTNTEEENSENKTEDEHSENNTETDNSDTKTDDVPEDGAGIVPAEANDTNVDDNEGKQANDENGNSDTDDTVNNTNADDDTVDNTNPDDDTVDNTNADDDTGDNTSADGDTGDNTNADDDSGDNNGKGGATSNAASLTILLAIVMNCYA